MGDDPKRVGGIEVANCASTVAHCYYILRINAYTGKFRGCLGPYKRKDDAERRLAALKSAAWNEDDGSKLLEVPSEVIE